MSLAEIITGLGHLLPRGSTGKGPRLGGGLGRADRDLDPTEGSPLLHSQGHGIDLTAIDLGLL